MIVSNTSNIVLDGDVICFRNVSVICYPDSSIIQNVSIVTSFGKGIYELKSRFHLYERYFLSCSNWGEDNFRIVTVVLLG